MISRTRGLHDRQADAADRPGGLTTWIALGLIVASILLVVLILSITPEMRGDEVSPTIAEEPVSE